MTPFSPRAFRTTLSERHSPSGWYQKRHVVTKLLTAPAAGAPPRSGTADPVEKRRTPTACLHFAPLISSSTSFFGRPAFLLLLRILSSASDRAPASVLKPRSEIVMLFFVTGAAGFVGSHVVKDLIANGHRVLGLARSEENATKLRELGADIHQGSLDDSESLSAGAAKADGVIHLAFKHDFENFVANCELDERVITALAKPLLGTGKPLVVTSGTLMVRKNPGDDPETPATEDEQLPPVEGHPMRRISETTALSLASQGVRTSIVRLCPTVHGAGDRGIISRIAEKARENGFVAYLGNGDGVLPGVHVKDAATLFRLAVESAPAGSILHAVAEERVPFMRVLEVVADKLGVPMKQLGQDEAGQLGILAMFLSANNPTSSKKTREMLGWSPKEIGLVEDVKENYAF